MSFLEALPEEIKTAVETIAHAVEEAAPVVDAVDTSLASSSQTVTVEDVQPEPALTVATASDTVVSDTVGINTNDVNAADVLAEVQALRSDITSAVSIVADLHAKIAPILDGIRSEGLPGLLKELPNIMSALKSL